MPSVVALFLAQERGTPMQRVLVAEARAGRGFVGCRHSKRTGSKRQLLLLDRRSLDELELAPGALKENVIVEGVPLESLPAGQRLRLGAKVTVELTGPCVPCHKLERIRPGLLSESWGKRGQLAQVLTDGTIEEGAEVTLLDVNPDAPRNVTPRLP